MRRKQSPRWFDVRLVRSSSYLELGTTRIEAPCEDIAREFALIEANTCDPAHIHLQLDAQSEWNTLAASPVEFASSVKPKFPARLMDIAPHGPFFVLVSLAGVLFAVGAHTDATRAAAMGDIFARRYPASSVMFSRDRTFIVYGDAADLERVAGTISNADMVKLLVTP